MGLGVVGDADGLVQIGGNVDIDVADAVQMLDHRDLGVAADALDQALAATRYDHVDVFGHGDQCAHGGTIGRFHYLHGARGQAGFGQALLDAGGDCLIGVDRLGATAQDGRVTRLQAQAGRVDGHVRPRFVDDPDHAQRHAHLADLDAGRHIAHVADFADRIRQRSDLTQALDHVIDARRSQGQAIQHGWLQTVGPTIGQILFVGFGQLGAGSVQGIGGGQQGTVLLRSGSARNDARRFAGGAAQAAHIIEDGLGHGSRRLA
ncbi:hypothetical protein D3C81_1332620 [compost metagenome]